MGKTTVEAQVMPMAERLRRFGDGPWLTEPDRISWRHGPIRCEMLRNMDLGVWCGYVALEPIHPWYRVPKDRIAASVHGGVTFTDMDDHGAWWVGFDCGHGLDYVPGLAQSFLTVFPREIMPMAGAIFDAAVLRETYRTRAYAADHTQRLAEQARRAMAGKGGAGWQSDLSN